MAVVARIRNLDFKQFLKLSAVLITRPLFVLPTLKATSQTVKICNRLFGADHNKNNRENAFRHALWNYLICKKCMKFSNNKEKVIGWSKKITDLHEKLFPNFELAEAMDLHNNEIGRRLFKDRNKTVNFIWLLQEMMNTSVKIKNLQELQEANVNLVYLE